jgi:hypothetical protein
MKYLTIIIVLFTLTSCENNQPLEACECRWEERIISERINISFYTEPVSDYFLVEESNIIDCLQDGITENTSTGERTLICE